MYEHKTNLRVRYNETDKMGVVYHSHYIEYYEVARTECMRSLGISYRELEETGIILPVIRAESNYRGSLFYDDEIEVLARITEMPEFKIKFDYEVLKNSKCVNKGHTELLFYNEAKKRPCKAPEALLEKLKPFFAKNTKQ